jgi:hypothetical protein
MMRPVLQRRPRRGADFVLPDVPMLDSPDWSDEDTPARRNASPPQVCAAAAAAAAARAGNTPLMLHPGMVAPNGNAYYSPVGMPRGVMPPQPQPLNGMRYPSPGLPRASPALEQQQRRTPQPRRVGRYGRSGGRPEYRTYGGGCDGSHGVKADSRSMPASVEVKGGSHAARQRNQEKDEGMDSEGGDECNYDLQGGIGDEVSRERLSPSHVAMGSFAATTVDPHTHFAGGSLFVSRQRDDDSGEAAEGVSLGSGTVVRRFSDDNNNSSTDSDSGQEVESSHRPLRRRADAESVVAPSYAVGLGHPADHKGVTDEQRKPSLFLVSAANSGHPNNNVNNDASTHRIRNISAAPSVFDRLMEAEEDGDESLVDRLGLGTSTVFVGPQSVRLERSTGPLMYTYEGGGIYNQQPQQESSPQTQHGASDAPSTDGTSGAHTAVVHHHGTFLLSTEDAHQPGTAASTTSPVGHASVYSTFVSNSAHSPLQQTALSPVHWPLMHATKTTSSADREGSGRRRRSLVPTVSDLRSHSLDGNPSTASNNDYDLMRDTGSVVPLPAVPKSARHPSSSRSILSGDESEEERYEQIQQSRFFRSLNSRLTLRKAAEMEATRASACSASTTWQGAAGGAAGGSAGGEDDVVVFSPSCLASRERLCSARGGRATSVGISAPSSATPNTDRLNFRNRIVSRQQQQGQPVQSLSRFPATCATSTPSAKPDSGSGVYALVSAMDTTTQKGGATTTTASTTEAECNSSGAAGKPTTAPSTLSTGTMGGYDGDEYCLLYWASSPTGTRRTSAVSVEDPSETAAGARGARWPSPSNAGGNGGRSAAVPLSLQPALIAMPRRSMSAVTVVSPSDQNAVSFSHPTPGNTAPPLPLPPPPPPQQQQQMAPFAVGNSPSFSLGVGDIPSPPAPASAPVPRPSGVSADQRVTDDSDGVQWTPNDDIFAFHTAGYSPTVGRRVSSPSISSQGPHRSPSFSGYRINDYFLLNSFRSNTAPPPPPPSERGESNKLANGTGGGYFMAPMTAVMTNGSNSTSDVIAPANTARTGPAPGIQQKRLSGKSNDGSGGQEKMQRLPSSAPLPMEAVAVVARSPRVPSKKASGISVDALRGLEDYGFPVDLEHHSNSSDYYYGMY